MGRTGPSAPQGPAATPIVFPSGLFLWPLDTQKEGRGPIGDRGQISVPGRLHWGLGVSVGGGLCVSVTPGMSYRADWGLPGGLKMLEGNPWGYARPPARGGGLRAQEAHPHPTQQEAHA